MFACKGINNQECKSHFKSPIKEVSLNFTNANIQNVYDYERFITSKYELIENNILKSTYRTYNGGSSLAYGDNTGHSIPPIYSFRFEKKPTRIFIKAMYNNVASYPYTNGYFQWFLRFTGGTTGKEDYPLEFKDFDSQNQLNYRFGVFTDNTKLYKALTSGWNSWSYSFDMKTDCPSCFTTEEAYYIVSVCSPAGIASQGSYNNGTNPLYIQELEIM